MRWVSAWTSRPCSSISELVSSLESIGFFDDDETGSEFPERFVCRPDLGVSLVVRGMGASVSGAPAAELMAQSLVEHLERGVGSGHATGSGGGSALAAAIQAGNQRLFARAHSGESFTSFEGFLWAGMRATLVALHAEDDALSIAHVGDCRAYLVGRAAQRALTLDHSLVNELRDEPLPPDFDLTVYQNVLTRSLGSEPTISVDLRSEPWSPGDRVLLCTPALTRLLDEQEIGAVLDPHGADLMAAGRRLLELARTRRQARWGYATRFLTFTLSRRLERSSRARIVRRSRA